MSTMTNKGETTTATTTTPLDDPTALSNALSKIRLFLISHRWDDVEELVDQFHPRDVATLERSYDVDRLETPLSNSVRVRAPFRVVRRLVNVCPDAVCRPARGRGGRTPLHRACTDARRRSSGDTIFEEDAAAVELMVSVRPRAAVIPDEDGQLPLHYACANRFPLSTVRCLARAFPNGVEIVAEGRTPLASLWERWALNEEDGRCLLSPFAARFHRRVNGDDSLSTETNDDDAATTTSRVDWSDHTTPAAFARRGTNRPRNNSAALWAKVLAMVSAVENRDNDDDDLSHPLHALASLSATPPSLLEFALTVHGGDALRMPDRRRGGDLPLHRAASVRPRCRDNEEEEEGARRARIVEILLEAWPAAASRRNSEGRYPLALALEAKWSWESGVIEPLWKAWTDISAVRDAKTGLCPAFAAGSSGDVDTCLRLLLRDPTVVTTMDRMTGNGDANKGKNEREPSVSR